jgi:hypothetical protein
MQTLRRALVMPAADFWLLGGLSAVVLGAIWLGCDHAHIKPFEQGLPSWLYYAAFAVNYPHFAYSYQLFYKGFFSRLRGAGSRMSKLRLIAAGIVAPLAMAVYFLYDFATKNVDMLSWGAISMLFLVGWHYAKQGYGVLITQSVYRNVFYSPMQKRIFYANAYIVWIFSWVVIHMEPGRAVVSDVIYSIPVMPPLVILVSGYALLISTLLTACAFIKAAIVDRKGISWNGLTGYLCAVYLWLLVPQILGSAMFFLAVPFFHGLQYLPFVYKYKKSEYGEDAGEAGFWRKKSTLMVVFALAGMALGASFMDFGPQFADRVYDPPAGFTKNFFLIFSTVFINIHHYLIDHSFWRRDNDGAQKFLFRA